MRIRMSFLMTLILVFLALPAVADHTTTGSVSGPTPFTYTIKCNPGESFLVEVTSDHPTSVNILSMTPDSRADGGWAFNAVQTSEKAYSHLLDYKAPSGKPSNNASHWHYRVSILASTSEQTGFELSISLFGGEETSEEFNKKAKEQLEALARNLNNEYDELIAEINDMDTWLEPKVKELNDRFRVLGDKKAEIARIDEAIKSESDTKAKEGLLETRRDLAAEFSAEARQYNDDFRQIENDLESRNAMVRRSKAIDELGESLRTPFNNKDYGLCVAIANRSDIARELGWVAIER